MDARTGSGRTGMTNGRHDGELPPDDELDALADLFLGPGAAPPPAREVKPGVEALVLGHLPVFAAAWPAQLARHLAERRGSPVALVRWEAGSLGVQLVGAGAGTQACATDAEALEAALRAADLTLLRVPEALEAELVATPGLDQVSILTGADDAAIVGCYRRLKGLAASAAEAGAALPGVRLVVMGATEEKARGAHERVLRAARAFLAADLCEPVVIPRIAPVHAASLIEAPTSLSLAGLTSLLRGERRDEPALRASAPVGSDQVDRARAAAPVVAPACAPEREVTLAGGSLVDLVPGLTALESRCPGAERVVLARDAAGALHLVAASLCGAPSVSTEDPLGDLLHAGAWAGVNVGLVARAEGVALTGGGVVLHLVTDNPGRAQRLAGTAVRVHLAARAGASAFGLVAVRLGG